MMTDPRGTSGWRAITVALGILVVARLSIHCLPATSHDYHPDEGVWIAAGHRAFQAFFIDGDRSEETWTSEGHGHFAQRNPVVGKYLIGGALEMARVAPRGQDIPGYELPFDWEAVRSRRPPAPMLEAGRAPMAWLGAGSAALLALLVVELTGSLATGGLAGAGLVLRAGFLQSSRRAMVDMPALFFGLLALWLGARLLRRSEITAPVVTRSGAVGLTIVVGLAVGCKMNALLVLAVLVAWVGLRSLERRGERRRLEGLRVDLARREVMGLGLVLTTVLTIVWVAPNPYLYREPLRNTERIFRLGRMVRDYDVPAEIRLEGILEKGAYVLQLGLAYSAPLARWWGWPGVDAALIAAGALLVVHRVRRPKGDGARWSFLLAWVVIVGVGVMGWTPFRWVRYALPLEPIWATLEAVGAVGIASRVASQLGLDRSREIAGISTEPTSDDRSG